MATFSKIWDKAYDPQYQAFGGIRTALATETVSTYYDSPAVYLISKLEADGAWGIDDFDASDTRITFTSTERDENGSGSGGCRFVVRVGKRSSDPSDSQISGTGNGWSASAATEVFVLGSAQQDHEIDVYSLLAAVLPSSGTTVPATDFLFISISCEDPNNFSYECDATLVTNAHGTLSAKAPNVDTGVASGGGGGGQALVTAPIDADNDDRELNTGMGYNYNDGNDISVNSQASAVWRFTPDGTFLATSDETGSELTFEVLTASGAAVTVEFWWTYTHPSDAYGATQSGNYNATTMQATLSGTTGVETVNIEALIADLQSAGAINSAFTVRMRRVSGGSIEIASREHSTAQAAQITMPATAGGASSGSNGELRKNAIGVWDFNPGHTSASLKLNGPPLQNWAANDAQGGKPDYGYDGEGVGAGGSNWQNPYVTIPAAYRTATEWSVAAWVRWDGTQRGNYSAIDIFTNGTWKVETTHDGSTNTELVFGNVYSDGSTSTGAGSEDTNADRWNHWSLTYDGTDLKLYVNGVETRTLAAVGLELGQQIDFVKPQVSNSSDTVIPHDVLGVWRSALSVEAIAELYASGDGETVGNSHLPTRAEEWTRDLDGEDDLVGWVLELKSSGGHAYFTFDPLEVYNIDSESHTLSLRVNFEVLSGTPSAFSGEVEILDPDDVSIATASFGPTTDATFAGVDITPDLAAVEKAGTYTIRLRYSGISGTSEDVWQEYNLLVEENAGGGSSGGSSDTVPLHLYPEFTGTLANAIIYVSLPDGSNDGYVTMADLKTELGIS